jgi:hypothetical protein
VNATVMSKIMTGTMRSCSQSQTVFPAYSYKRPRPGLVGLVLGTSSPGTLAGFLLTRGLFPSSLQHIRHDNTTNELPMNTPRKIHAAASLCSTTTSRV